MLAQPCPCGTGRDYAQCCRPLHRQERVAASALLLMRSRYAAFALGLAEYLLASWHPSTRPASLDLTAQPVRWCGLEICSCHEGLSGDLQGTVEFIASYRSGPCRERLHEHSRFVCEAGRWYYVDGDVV